MFGAPLGIVGTEGHAFLRVSHMLRNPRDRGVPADAVSQVVDTQETRDT